MEKIIDHERKHGKLLKIGVHIRSVFSSFFYPNVGYVWLCQRVFKGLTWIESKGFQQKAWHLSSLDISVTTVSLCYTLAMSA